MCVCVCVCVFFVLLIIKSVQILQQWLCIYTVKVSFNYSVSECVVQSQCQWVIVLFSELCRPVNVSSSRYVIQGVSHSECASKSACLWAMRQRQAKYTNTISRRTDRWQIGESDKRNDTNSKHAGTLTSCTLSVTGTNMTPVYSYITFIPHTQLHASIYTGTYLSTCLQALKHHNN